MEDLKTQAGYGVNYLRYLVDEKEGKVFCLVEAPDADAARPVHQEAHGLVAYEIDEVQEGSKGGRDKAAPNADRGRVGTRRRPSSFVTVALAGRGASPHSPPKGDVYNNTPNSIVP